MLNQKTSIDVIWVEGILSMSVADAHIGFHYATDLPDKVPPEIWSSSRDCGRHYILGTQVP